MTEEYRDGEFEYGIIESSIEEIVDRYGFRAFLYLESDKYDNVSSTSMAADDEDDSAMNDMQMNALVCLIADILKSRASEDRYAVIAEIYDTVHDGIHLDDEPEDEKLDEEY